MFGLRRVAVGSARGSVRLASGSANPNSGIWWAPRLVLKHATWLFPLTAAAGMYFYDGVGKREFLKRVAEERARSPEGGAPSS